MDVGQFEGRVGVLNSGHCVFAEGRDSECAYRVERAVARVLGERM